MNTTTEKFTKISGLTFEVIDMRGQNGFPKNHKGMAYVHDFARRTYVIRTDGNGWRIDQWDGAPEAVPGYSGYYNNRKDAAEALAEYICQKMN